MERFDMKIDMKRDEIEVEEVEIEGSFYGYERVLGMKEMGNEVIEKGDFESEIKERGE